MHTYMHACMYVCMHTYVRTYVITGPPSAKWQNFVTNGPIFIIFFTVKFRKDLRRKLELKLSPLLKSVAALPCEM